MNNLYFFIDSLCKTTQYFDETFESKICTNAKKIFEFVLSRTNTCKEYCLKEVEYKSVVINLILCDNKQIHEINKEYRHVDRPTDVISFALFADSPEEERFIFDGEINLGDIFLSLEKTSEQATENNVSFEYEFYYLLSHSILHLLGFDHQDKISYDFMVNIQKEALGEIGV